MFKNTNLKKIALVLGGVLILSAFKWSGTQVNNPTLVLEKMITQAAKVYEVKTQVEIDSKNNQTGEWSTFEITNTQRTDARDIDDFQTESHLQVHADLNILGYNYNEELQEFDQKLEQMSVDGAGEVKMMGDDVYASFTQLEVEGNGAQAEQINATLPLVTGPYKNQIFYFSLDTLEDSIEKIEAQTGQTEPDLRTMMEYSQGQKYQDLSDSGALKVTQDYGTKRIKTLSEKEIDTFHYKITLDAKGIESLLTKMDDQLDLFSDEEMEEFLNLEELNLEEVVGVINDATTIEIWIGKKNYHPYRMEINSDLERIKAAIQTLESSEYDLDFTQEDLEFSMNLVMESQPLRSLRLKRPDQDSVLDLNPMIKEFL